MACRAGIEASLPGQRRLISTTTKPRCPPAKAGGPPGKARWPADRLKRSPISDAWKSRPRSLGSSPSRARQPGIVGSYVTCEGIDPGHRSDAGHLPGLVVHLRCDHRVNRRSRSRGTEPSWVRPGRDRASAPCLSRRADRRVACPRSKPGDPGIQAYKFESPGELLASGCRGKLGGDASLPWARRVHPDASRVERLARRRIWPAQVSSATLLTMVGPRTLTVSVEVPLSAGDGASPDPTAVGRELRLLWIIEQVRLRRIGVGRGAALAGLPRAASMQALGAHGVPVIDYAPSDLQRELDAQHAG